jgi:flagellin-specific chaperone FliS
LEVLDRKLKEAIGENYIGHKKISAKVSFLALAECLAPQLKTKEEKNKFLSKFPQNYLLEKSLFFGFTEFIADDLIQNTNIKIKKSNFNKANNVLKELISLLESVSERNINPLYNQLSNELQDVTYNLDKTVQATKNRMKSSVEKAIRNFENKTRKMIYSEIDKNIGEDLFEKKFKSIIEKMQCKCFQNDLSIMLEKERNRFQDEINEVMVNFNRRANNTIKEFRSISSGSNDFKLDIDIDNGINGMGLMGSAVGTVGLAYSVLMFSNAWNPLGWTMFAVGVVTTLISFGKSIYKFFSDDYKKSEQRKIADKNIARIAKDIEITISEKLTLSFKEFDKLIDTIKGDVESDVEQVKKLNEYIIDSKVKLMQLSKNIQTEGQKQ